MHIYDILDISYEGLEAFYLNIKCERINNNVEYIIGEIAKYSKLEMSCCNVNFIW